MPIWALTSVFSAGSGGADADLDRNLFGETGTQAARGRAAAARWSSYVQTARTMTFPRPASTEFIGPPATVPPIGAPWSARTDRLTALASVAGLAGLAFDPRFPSGYETTHPEMMEGGYDAPLCVRAEMGYAVEMRLGFLRADGVDPVDLIPDNLTFPSDLRTPFFLDDHARGMSSIYSGRDNPVAGFAGKAAKWNAFRGVRRLEALAALRKAIQDKRPDLPVVAAPVVTARLNGEAPNYGPASSYSVWLAAAAAPTEHVSDSNPFSPQTPAPGATTVSMVVVPAAADGGATGGADYAAFTYGVMTMPPLRQQSAQPPYRMSLDLSALSPAAASAVLAKWFKPARAGAAVTASLS
jgi:hypothetical protein